MGFSKKTTLVLAALTLVAALSSCDGGESEVVSVTGPYFTGYEAKTTYNAYLGTTIDTLNTAQSQSASDVMHIANFVDGLLMNNEFGILERQLASSARVDDQYRNFYFTIKENVPWFTYDGREYVAKNNQGKEEKQYVVADDFVNTAQIILNYSNQSKIAYMVTLFIDGAWEYFCYTYMNYLIGERNTSYAGINWASLRNLSNDSRADALEFLIAHESGMDPNEIPIILGEDLAAIANFSRVGIIAESKYEIHYRLNQTALFFPTLLTYAPFYPINRAFFAQQRFSKFGTSKETILYNGPFLCSEWTDTKVQYKRNDKYYKVDDVHIKTVNYIVAASDTRYSDMRESFENGVIDGFTIAPEDSLGWAKYITGGTPESPGSGTVENPFSPLVNSRELDLIDFTYHFTLNIERPTDPDVQPNTIFYEGSGAPFADPEAEIINTNRALKIKEVRRLILDGIDFEYYNVQNEASAIDIHQYQLNTFTPPKYVFDENDKDYIEYYYEEYARQKGLDDAAAAKALIGPQTIEGVNYSDEEALQMRLDAEIAVQQYNELNPTATIKLPIFVENAGLAGVSPSQTYYENNWINNFNNRINAGLQKGSEFVKIINNIRATSSEVFSANSSGGYYTISSWGWIGDYADPLTYLHTYVTNGDMSQYTGTKLPLDNYFLDESGNLHHHPNGLLAEYDELVDEASEINSSNALRYEAFAKAEYELINNVYLIKPHSMNSQGWAMSVSRAVGYQNPTASYGLATYRLTGMWVLTEPPTGDDRKEAREVQAIAKAAALEEFGVYNYLGSDED